MLTKEDLDQLKNRSLPAVKNLGERKLLQAAADVMDEGDVPGKISAARMAELQARCLENRPSVPKSMTHGAGDERS